MSGMPALESSTDEMPLIYVACPLTNLSTVGRQSICATVDNIKLRIEHLTVADRVAAEQWPVAVYAPVEHSAPWKEDGRSPADIYELNLGQVLDADAMIVLGDRTVTAAGVGQEIEWAVRAGLPILYLTPGAAVSRQISGTPARLEVADFGSDMDTLRLRLDGWLRVNRTLIEDGPRRRRDRQLQYAAITSRLRDAWRTVPDPTSAAARCNLHPSLVDSLLRDPARVALMPSEWLERLTAELGVPKSMSGPQLRIRAVRAWLSYTASAGLDDAAAERLRLFALADVARDPRCDFDTPAAWRRLAERIRT
jgi:hypothetical protein